MGGVFDDDSVDVNPDCEPASSPSYHRGIRRESTHLTTRELECLRWIARGKDAKEIAIILNISPHTVRDYLKSVHYKLDCVTSAQAVSKAVRLGLLTF